MTKEQINEYTMRISQANTSQLALILYEIVIACMKEALQIYDAKADGYESEFEKTLVQAQNFLQELISMSRMDSKDALDVMSIYLFVDKQILLSIVKKKPVNLVECLSYLERLQAAFVELSKTDEDTPIMENTQQVYAGLTYGKGYLTESMDPMGNVNRGYKA